VRDNKRVQLQWEKNSTTVANFLEGKGVSLKDKMGNPTTKVPNPKYSEDEPLMCHCWQQQCISHIAGGGGYFCFYGCDNQITGKQYEEGQCPFFIVIVRSCEPKSELILLISFLFDSVLVCLI
jgi:hypothetical protein